jgi:hypothetical protein
MDATRRALIAFARRLGEDILGHLAARLPRTKVGRAARDKLGLGAGA